ncbi:uncharacterized protein PV09_02477 [Verruconis gallopava]|uniref:SH3 domain-containing protein n=1 Tax=Verruconis gallopava TaxID=253628 RepID=A0A0D1Z1I2_9PEZI|nr:uncharacterized protein PV09_02477 [Verruconis gallopava]KIW06797.1 hypothetical protein PV09_02477 [Verruconis gallopava]
MASCISLRGSTACPAFNASSVSTDDTLRGLFPFLKYVDDTASFDEQLKSYIATTYAQLKYQTLLGCSNVSLTNTTDLYARYTTTFLCNAVVQNSVNPCKLTGAAARPVCAETCAEFATSEEQIASTKDLCGTTGDNAISQIRADFTTCALPDNSLNSDQCIQGVTNEPDNCGFADNLPSLCSYCASSSPNSTDSCCVNAQTETRCTNVKLPITASMGAITSSVASATASSSAGAAAGSSHGSGLSGGAIAGIVIGSIVGALLLLALIIGCCILIRRRRNSKIGSTLNQPSPSRHGPPATSMTYASPRTHQDNLPVGARVHQLSALEATDASPLAAAGMGKGAYDITPESQRTGLGVAAISKRGGSLSADGSSPNTGDFSSPEGAVSGDSEALSHFKDYYSQDDIRSGDAVATLWAYQPRAQDEWELERGDMIKVIGIWDDGWATGIKLNERAEDWSARNENRDSGVSNGSRAPPTDDNGETEIKAFPLVCVCLPQHWRKIVDSDGPGGGMGGPPSGTP